MLAAPANKTFLNLTTGNTFIMRYCCIKKKSETDWKDLKKSLIVL